MLYNNYIIYASVSQYIIDFLNILFNLLLLFFGKTNKNVLEKLNVVSPSPAILKMLALKRNLFVQLFDCLNIPFL